MFFVLFLFCFSIHSVLHAVDVPSINPKYDMDNKESICYKVQQAILSKKDFKEYVIDGFSPIECRDLNNLNLLHIAVLGNNEDAITTLIEKYGFNYGLLH
jgi:hypothetical protein